jgi:hypothetical protein
MVLKFAQRGIASGLVGVGLLITEAIYSPTHAAQQFSCTGSMKSGWNYTAEFLDGRFTQIRWERSGQPPQVSRLTFSSTNVEGHPVYRGSFQAATAVTLVDLSGGDVRPGSQISVGVEEWGWSRGTCGTTAGGGTGSSSSAATMRQNLLGVEQEQAREWLRQNNLFFTQTMEHTNTRVVERWNFDTSRAVDVIIVDGIVSDVVEAR